MAILWTREGGTERLIRALGLDDASLRVKVATIAALARAEWVRLANLELRSTQQTYTQQISAVVLHGVVAVITLGDGSSPASRLANMVEWGWYENVGVDLRKTVIPNAKNVRWTQPKDGSAPHRYVHVPFRLMGPGATGRNAQPIGHAYQGTFGAGFSTELAQRVMKAAKALTPSTSAPGKPGSFGTRLPEEDGGPLLRPRHTTGLYSGMYRAEKGYAKSTGSKFGTFRTISEAEDSKRSDYGGVNWYHPGITARHLVDRVVEHIHAVTPGVFGAVETT